MSKKIPLFALVSILIVSFAVMVSVSSKDSMTMDELAHIPAGYGYLKYLDYRLNPEHPPLIKVFSAVPLVFMGLHFPTDDPSWTSDINGQWIAGNKFIYHSGNNADQLVFWARLGPVILTLLLIILIYVWARELLGNWWGLLPAFLFAFSPTVLAHGHYVTTDIAAALGVVLGTYFFIKYLLKPTSRNLIFSGLALGVAQLLKFSAVLLIPYFVVLILIWFLRTRKRFWRQFWSLAAIFIIAYVLVYLVYYIFTLNYPISKQVADTKFILSSFKHRLFADLDVFMAGNQFLRPLGHYLLGVLMVGQRSVSGNTAYFLGQVSAAGWWYYFPLVFLFKESIPSLILIFTALILGIWGFIKSIKLQKFRLSSYGRSLEGRQDSELKIPFLNYKLKAFNDYLGTHFAEFSMILFVVFYWLYSIQGKLNIGIRHILPTMPFIYILTTAGLKNWVNSRCWKYIFKIGFIFIFVFWYLLEMIWVYPYYLSYFNQFGGGVANGYRIVTDSNYDWGQDLKRLAAFVEEKGIQKIAVDYFGGGDTGYFLGSKAENWWSGRGNPKDESIEWLAVSINSLEGSIAKTAPGFERKPEDEYRWLQAIRNPFEPDFKAGTSIFIYKL